jgi:hypothetical protein
MLNCSRSNTPRCGEAHQLLRAEQADDRDAFIARLSRRARTAQRMKSKIIRPWAHTGRKDPLARLATHGWSGQVSAEIRPLAKRGVVNGAAHCILITTRRLTSGRRHECRLADHPIRRGPAQTHGDNSNADHNGGSACGYLHGQRAVGRLTALVMAQPMVSALKAVVRFCRDDATCGDDSAH